MIKSVIDIIKQKRDFLLNALHIFVLSSFAFAQPLFDLLSRNATFFVAHRSEPIDFIILILILCGLLPTLIITLEVLAGLLGKRVRKGVHGFIVAGLVAIIALPAIDKIFKGPGIMILIGGMILGMIFTAAYFRLTAIRLFITVLAPALLVFPGFFLFNSPVSKMFFVKVVSRVPASVKTGNENIPVVLIVFDALSETSLMDENYEIDSIRYPGFSALAKDATWFRNATAVSDYTHLAVPAILSGLYPDKPRLPTFTDYPRNIFSLLSSSYDFIAHDPNTQLCPDQWNGHKNYKNITERVHTMLLDLSIVYLHIILPSDLKNDLPVVTRTWKDFTGHGRGNSGRDEKSKESMSIKQGRWIKAITKGGHHHIKRFIKSIRVSERPTLYYLHSLFPHAPWRFLPSGKAHSHHKDYTRIRGLNGYGDLEMWSTDEFAIVQAYQRYLLQLGFTDKILGAVIDHMKEVGIYDRSLIIVTADHGVSFRANDKRRPITESNYQDIMSVPLFIKVPFQDQGTIDHRNIETIDILPSIADVLGISFPWPVDGQSVFDRFLPERASKLFYTDSKAKKKVSKLVFEKTLDKKYETLDKMLTLFGSGSRPNGLYGIGPHTNLLGQPVDEIAGVGESGYTIEINQEKTYEHVNPDAPFVPAHISGALMPNGIVENPLILAVSVNGIIRAVTRSFPVKPSRHEWSVIVQEASFRPGKNDINVFHLTEDDNSLRLYLMRKKRAVHYTLSGSGKKNDEKIITSEGRSMPVVAKAIDGWLDQARINNGRVKLRGWAVDIRNLEAPDGIVITLNGNVVYSDRPNMPRVDVANHFKNDSLEWVGFSCELNLGDIEGIHNQEMRVFAFSRDVASELNYNKKNMWRK